MGEFSALAQRRHAPLCLAVTGHRGTGRDTVALALRRWFGVRAGVPEAAPSPADTDVVLHVLGAGVRGCDRDFLAAQQLPVIVAAGKADLRGVDPAQRAAAAQRLAERAAEDLACAVYPVSGLLATAEIDGSLLAELRRWAAAGIAVPRPAVAFADGDDPGRAAALAVLGGAGLDLALGLCARDPAADAAEVTGRLRAASGFAALVDPIRRLRPVIGAHRERRHRRGLTVLAARAGEGLERDRMEGRLLR